MLTKGHVINEAAATLTLQLNHIFSIITTTSTAARTSHSKLIRNRLKTIGSSPCRLRIHIRILLILILPVRLISCKIHTHIQFLLLLLSVLSSGSLLLRKRGNSIRIARLGGAQSKNRKMLRGENTFGIFPCGHLIIELLYLSAA